DARVRSAFAWQIGADRLTVIHTIMKQGAQLSLAGIAIGLLVSYFACRAPYFREHLHRLLRPRESARVRGHCIAASGHRRAGDVRPPAPGLACGPHTRVAGRVVECTKRRPAADGELHNAEITLYSNGPRNTGR